MIFKSIENKNTCHNDLSVIIRSCEERTEKLCKFSIIKNGIPEENIGIIRNISPFSRALKMGYEMGIKMNRKYTLFVDADYILTAGSMPLLIANVKNLPQKCFFINSLWYDYITESISPGGPHLYKTEFLLEALKHIPNEETSIRPETFTTKKMHELGFSSVYLDIPIAFHGFEQYRRDIFRNTINKYSKTTNETKKIKERVGEKATSDLDSFAILSAIEYAEKNKIKLKLDYKQFNEEFLKFKIEEKSPISEAEIPKIYSGLMRDLEQLKNSYTFKGYTYGLLNKKNESMISKFVRLFRF